VQEHRIGAVHADALKRPDDQRVRGPGPRRTIRPSIGQVPPCARHGTATCRQLRIASRSRLAFSSPTRRPRTTPSAPMNTVVGRPVTPSLAPGTAAGVGRQRIGDPGLGDQAAGRVLLVEVVDAQQAHTVSDLEGDGLEDRHLGAARIAPGRPDIEH
jgi:hypothetical protein